jgi:hypothetical protein
MLCTIVEGPVTLVLRSWPSVAVQVLVVPNQICASGVVPSRQQCGQVESKGWAGCCQIAQIRNFTLKLVFPVSTNHVTQAAIGI